MCFRTPQCNSVVEALDDIVRRVGDLECPFMSLGAPQNKWMPSTPLLCISPVKKGPQLLWRSLDRNGRELAQLGIQIRYLDRS